MDDVDEGIPLKTVAKSHGIPISSFRGHLYGTILTRSRGKKGALTKEEENTIVTYLLQMQNRGFPLHMGQLQAKVHELTQTRHTPFKDGIPGRGWVRCFLLRHPQLSLRKPQALEKNRAIGLYPENVMTFYDNLSNLYKKNRYHPYQI